MLQIELSRNVDGKCFTDIYGWVQNEKDTANVNPLIGDDAFPMRTNENYLKGKEKCFDILNNNI